MSNDAATAACLAAGVPAGPMLTGASQSTDPHLEARGYVQWREQPPIGKMIFEGGAFHASAMIGPDIFPAPGLGEQTREIAAEWLGVPADEIEPLVEAGVLETDPPFGS